MVEAVVDVADVLLVVVAAPVLAGGAGGAGAGAADKKGAEEDEEEEDEFVSLVFSSTVVDFAVAFALAASASLCSTLLLLLSPFLPFFGGIFCLCLQ